MIFFFFFFLHLKIISVHDRFKALLSLKKFLNFKAQSICDASITGSDPYLVLGETDFVATLIEQRLLGLISLNLLTNFAIQIKFSKWKRPAISSRCYMQTQNAKSRQNITKSPQIFNFWQILDHIASITYSSCFTVIWKLSLHWPSILILFLFLLLFLLLLLTSSSYLLLLSSLVGLFFHEFLFKHCIFIASLITICMFLVIVIFC